MPLGCLLLHGFGGSPFEMFPVAQALEEEGYVVRVPALPGHDSTLENFLSTGFQDWYEAAEDEFTKLKNTTSGVLVCGLSMGGSLALKLAQHHDVAGIVTIAAPVFVYTLFPPRMRDWRLPFVPLLQHVRPVWPGNPRRPESEALAPWRGYDGVTALPPLASLIRGLRDIRRDLRKVRAPLLAMHCPTDRTAPVTNLWKIAEGVSSMEREMHLLPILEGVTHHHLLTTHVETRERVRRQVAAFARRIASGRGLFHA